MTNQKNDLQVEYKRAKKDETDISHRRRWFSRCGDYEVNESTSKYEIKDNGKPLVVYYAIFGQKIIGRHRLKRKAEETCENHKRKSLGLPMLRAKRKRKK